MTVNEELSMEALNSIKYSASTSEINIPWEEFKIHMKNRLKENFKYFMILKHSTTEEDSKLFLTEEKKKDLEFELTKTLVNITNFLGRPFTFQRICELLVEPDIHHPTLSRYMEAINKLCSVVTYDEDRKEEEIDLDEVATSVVDIEELGSVDTLSQGIPSIEDHLLLQNNQSESDDFEIETKAIKKRNLGDENNTKDNENSLVGDKLYTKEEELNLFPILKDKVEDELLSRLEETDPTSNEILREELDLNNDIENKATDKQSLLDEKEGATSLKRKSSENELKGSNSEDEMK